MNRSGPLSRFKVLDLTRVRSGPTAVRQFADWGADVVMVESRQGSSDIAGSRDRSDFQNLNRNKRSLTLDLKSPEGREVFFRLAARADVLFENFRPDVKHRLGIDYKTLSGLNPGLVYVSISGFGENGPYADRPGLDQIVQGAAGLMSVTGVPGQGPVRAGIAVADSSAGLYGALGAMTALLEREVTGKGRWVCTSLLQAQIALMDFQAARYLVEGEIAEQSGNDHPTAAPMGLFATADNPINIAASSKKMFATLCSTLGLQPLLDDPRFDSRNRRKNHSALSEAIEAVTRTRPASYWIAELNKAGVPCGPVNRMDEVFADPQVRYSGIVQAVEHGRLGPLNLIGQPITMSGIEPALRSAAPELGADSASILRDYGFTQEEVDGLADAGVIQSTDEPAV